MSYSARLRHSLHSQGCHLSGGWFGEGHGEYKKPGSPVPQKVWSKGQLQIARRLGQYLSYLNWFLRLSCEKCEIKRIEVVQNSATMNTLLTNDQLSNSNFQTKPRFRISKLQISLEFGAWYLKITISRLLLSISSYSCRSGSAMLLKLPDPLQKDRVFF